MGVWFPKKFDTFNNIIKSPKIRKTFTGVSRAPEDEMENESDVLNIQLEAVKINEFLSRFSFAFSLSIILAIFVSELFSGIFCYMNSLNINDLTYINQNFFKNIPLLIVFFGNLLNMKIQQKSLKNLFETKCQLQIGIIKSI